MRNFWMWHKSGKYSVMHFKFGNLSSSCSFHTTWMFVVGGKWMERKTREFDKHCSYINSKIYDSHRLENVRVFFCRERRQTQSEIFLSFPHTSQIKDFSFTFQPFSIAMGILGMNHLHTLNWINNVCVCRIVCFCFWSDILA